MTTDRTAIALQAHAEYRAFGYEPIPVRIDRYRDDRGVWKKVPRFPKLPHHDKPTWETAREIGRTRASLEPVVSRFPDLALVCVGLAAFDFDLRTNEDETAEAFRSRVREAVDTYGLKSAVWERTGKGLHAIVQAPPEDLNEDAEPIPWKKRGFNGDPLLDEIQVGAGALLFVAPSYHPVAERYYERRSELRPVDELPVCPAELLRIPDPERTAPSRPWTPPPGEPLGSGLWSSLDIVGLFREAGMYRHPLRGGKHSVVCPWRDQHTTGQGPSDTTVWEASNGNGPAFHCLHKHCDGRAIKHVRSWFGADAVDRWCRQRFEGADALYQIHDVRNAAGAGSVVYLTDRREEADALTDAGLAASCIPRNPSQEALDALQGAVVVILGHPAYPRHADALQDALGSTGHVVRVNGFKAPDGSRVPLRDALANGYDPDTLAELVARKLEGVPT